MPGHGSLTGGPRPGAQITLESSPKIKSKSLYRGLDDDAFVGRLKATRGAADVEMPRGRVTVDGLWGGSNFGTHIKVGQRFHAWSEELGGRVVVWHAVGRETIATPAGDLATMRLELAPETFRGCGEGPPEAGFVDPDSGHPACLTPDPIPGAFDQSLIYKAPTMKSLPAFQGSEYLATQPIKWKRPSEAGGW